MRCGMNEAGREPARAITRRQLAGLLAAFGVASRLRGAAPALGLNHFKLRVSDLDRSVAFYYSLFGGPLAEVRGGSYLTPPGMRAIFLKLGSGKTYLVLSPPDSQVPVGLEHVALDRAGMAVVTENRIPLAFPPEPYVRDPDGNLLEFITSGYWTSAVPKQSPQLPPGVVNRKPVFEPLTIQRIALRVSGLRRAADFYKLFGAERGAEASKGRGAFDFQGTILELVSSRSAPGLDGFAVAVRNFDPASARRALGALGMKTWKQRGQVVLRDPDGNRVEVAAA